MPSSKAPSGITAGPPMEIALASLNELAAMRRAISLSKRGYPAPNPRVGCVIVRDGEIVGEGYHAAAGGPHAEVVALGHAGARAKGATVYVTLEPCAHHGRTPPCVDALRSAGVGEVFAACVDPNPMAQGGAVALNSAKIRTHVGFMAAEAEQANEIWLTAIRRRRPFVVAKVAMSLDGRVALASGESKWITGDSAKVQGHRLRAECGAVLVGRGTVEADDPRLTARIRGVVNQPTRIVLDPEAKLGPEKAIFGPGGPTLHFVRRRGADGQVEAPYGVGGFDLKRVLSDLFQGGVVAVLVEGGPATLTAFLKSGLVDRIELFVAPRLLGTGPTWLADLGVGSLSDSPRFAIERVRRVGADLWITLGPDRLSSR